MDTIISFCTSDIAEHAEVFLKTQRAYAERWGYNYWLFTNPIWHGEHVNSNKVPAIQMALGEMKYDETLIFFDADIGITNATADIGDVLRVRPECYLGAYLHKHWASWFHLCDGIILMRKSPELNEYMLEWVDRCLNGDPDLIPGRRVKIVDFPHEQWHFDACNRRRDFKGIHPATAEEVGAFSTIWSDGCAWVKGMPTVHCGGAQASWERRAQVFKEFYLPHVIE